MQSFLILSSNYETAQKKAQALCHQYAIDPLDQTILTSEKSIGIEDIRTVQKNILLTPFKSPYKATIILSADTMTHEAQNAFLKTLEEPPPHTFLLLLAKEENNFLSTVLSRCTIIRIPDEAHVTKSYTTTEVTDFLDSQRSLSEKLKQAELYGKNKDTALHWIEQLLHFTRVRMLEHPTIHGATMVRNIYQAHYTLSHTNAHPRLVIEHMLLSFQ